MAIGIFMEYGGQIVHFPVNPEMIGYSESSNNETTEVVPLGEINRLAITSLGSTEFESWFPGRPGRYSRTNNRFWTPKQYVDFFKKVRKEQKPVRFVVTDTQINFLASIEHFEYDHRAGEEEDMYYTIELLEYRHHEARQVKVVQQVSTAIKPVVVKKPAQSKSTNKPVTIGSTVIVNGRLHRDSYGTGPGKTEKNARRKVNFIKKGRSHPYHVTMLDGGWRGWVTAGSVKRVD